MSEPSASFDLTNCDREPIHIPGTIQPHGVLLVLAEPALTVTQVSGNVKALLHLDVAQVLGRSLAEVLDPEFAAELGTALAEDRWAERNPLRLQRRADRFDGIVHRHDGATILELEPASGAAPEISARHPLQPALEAVQQAVTLSDLSASVVRAVRRLTGFERVMFYRFDEEGHGSVDAEAKEPSLDPYLGLHYPASDIPQQARRLYLRNWLRIIPDGRYTPAAIVPALRPDTGAALDLAMSILRSVSPIHLEYMANMGVRASMSISLIVRDRLWGLISCTNHSGPLHVRYELRSTCEVLGRLVSLQIAALQDREVAASRSARRATLEALAAAMRAGDVDGDVLADLVARPAELMRLVGADGAAAVSEHGLVSCGRTPAPDAIRSITRWLEDRPESDVYATAALPTELPEVSREKDVASGVLVFALPGTPRRRLLWFRPEIIHTVNWGGDPSKPVESGAGARLHPRRSFEQWKERVRLRAEPWAAASLDAADELRRIALEIDLERQLLRAQKAVRARDDLVAILSHDLKSPLNVIQLQLAILTRSTPAGDDEPARRLRTTAVVVQRAVDRMTGLIRDLLDLSKIEARRFTIEPKRENVHELVQQALCVLRPLAETKRITIVDDLRVSSDVNADRERLHQVLSNLIGNAIKFAPQESTMTLRAERRGAEIVFSVADAGPGILPDQLPHIFERYWQGRPNDRVSSGLGLFIAKGIVEAHGGRIWVEAPPGHGATFMFTVPVA